MKRIFLSVLIIALFTTSCQKGFIELAPEDQQSAATFFKTEAQLKQALMAAYVPLRALMNSDYVTAEMRSDNTDYEYNELNRGTANSMKEDIPDFRDDADNSYTANIYYNCYLGISRANIVIDRIDGADIADSVKRNITGQAEFLRAFYYFRLVRYFGGVPLFIKEVTKAEEAFLLRSSADSVYEQIIADAKDAISKLNPPEKFPQTGEATKGAATTLLAEVYLTRKQYSDAVQLLETLPSMGYGLLSDYADVFSIQHKNSKESIFEVQYRQGDQGGQQSNFIYQFIPRSNDTKIITGVVTSDGGGGWNTPTEDLISAYEDGDKRLDVSIGIAEGNYNTSNLFIYSAKKSIVNYSGPPAGEIAVPFIKKYLNPSSLPNNTDDDWPIYRYSDALLMMAECLNEQGTPGEALPYLNEVRKRAGLDGITTTDQAELREIIIHERRVELAFENFRWFDLIRTGEAIEVMNAYGEKMKQTHSYLLPSSYHVTKERLLYPIPRAEVDLNPGLTQNPGY